VASLILIVAMLAVLWLVFIVPQRRRQATHQALLESVEVGDEVLTAGGLYGFVREIGDHDELSVEIAPGILVRVARRSVAAVIPEEEEELEDDEELEEEDEAEAAASPDGRYPDRPE
jgi:preprotein translocase subunit YajC